MLVQIGLAGLLGLLVGSFLATLSLRWGRGDSITSGRSRCDSCNCPLSIAELVPILSYLWQGGRCRSCQHPIDKIHPLAEGLGLAIGTVALALAPSSSGWIHALFGWMMLPLILLDARLYWLPDRLVAALAMVGLLAGGAMLDTDIVARLVGAVAAGLSLAALAMVFEKTKGTPAMGGGDPKLAAALGAWLGWQMVPMLFLLSSASGIVWALAQTAYRKTRETQAPPSAESSDSTLGSYRVAFGVFLCGAAWLLVAIV